MDPEEVLTRTAEGPDAVVRYADHADGVVDVFTPPVRRDGTPLVVLLHGGFWRSRFDRTHTRPMAHALVAAGFVVAAPEYRRVGGRGELAGGWPVTFADVSAAMAALPALLDGLGIRTAATTVVGHSAGGHLALLLAAGGRGGPETLAPRPPQRVVALAPVCDLRAGARDRLSDGAVQDFLGGEPEEVPDRYREADPMTRLGPEVAAELVVVHGAEDRVVPVGHSRGLAAARPQVRLVELAGVGHFEPIDPLSEAWPAVLSAVRGEKVTVP